MTNAEKIQIFILRLGLAYVSNQYGVEHILTYSIGEDIESWVWDADEADFLESLGFTIIREHSNIIDWDHL